MAADVSDIARCLMLIEQQLGWGPGVNWQQRDFELLSEKLFEKTTVLLSASTLKRVWGKTSHEGKPSKATLNALAQFIGFENWRAFLADNNTLANETLPEAQFPTIVKRKHWGRMILLIGFGIIAIAIVAFYTVQKRKNHLNFEQLVFNARMSTTGIPNTVLFDYDASHSNADSVFIQQSWDKRRRYMVDKAAHQYNLTYYYPGYYRAKLVLNDSIVKERDLFIASQGWMGIVEQNPIPIYLEKERFNKGLPLFITDKDFTDHSIDLQKELPFTSIVLVDSSIAIPGNKLLLNARIQNTATQPEAICHQATITLMGTEGVISIPICEKGCVGDINLVVGMHVISGRTTDLSGFGVDGNSEAMVQCNISGDSLIIRVNAHIAWQAPFTNTVGRVIGARIRFKGSGVVRQFDLRREN
ncbi:MAG: hypothetical protein QM726_10215 [Chitinophagaceae bacterium]